MLLTLYFVVAVLAYILALPYLIYLSFKEKYKDSIPARFFLTANPPFEQGGIWFHACSLGEVNSLKSLFLALGDEPLHVSVTTGTGFRAAKEIESLDVRFLPFEVFLPWWIRAQRVLIVTEAELWPMLFVASKRRGVKTVLINARISDHSFASYKRFAFLYRWIFAHIDVVFAQSQIDRSRLEFLGARDVRILGNIKTFNTPQVSKEYKPPKKMILLASTHAGEEELLLENLHLGADEMLVLAPRHPERFAHGALLAQKFASEHNRSFSKLSVDDTLGCGVVLCDVMGALVDLIAVSEVVILCGSFIEGIGGHNPLEPAFFHKKIISGPHVFNQNALFDLVENITICEAKELQTIDFDVLKPSNISHVGDLDMLLREISGKNNDRKSL